MRILLIILMWLVVSDVFAQFLPHRRQAWRTVPAVGGVSYILKQGFEGTGYDNSETWGESGTPNEDYTTSPIVPSQSWYSAASTSYSYTNFTAMTSFWAYVRFRIDAVPSAVTTIFQTLASNDATLLYISLRTAGNIRLYHGTNPTGSTNLVMGVNYSMWLYYEKGTGANSVGKLWLTREGETRTTDPYLSTTSGTGAQDAEKIRIYGASGGVVYDKLRLDDVEIGSSPE